MSKTIKNVREARRWKKEHEGLVPTVGDEAPDFELCDVNGENPVRLSDFRGTEPVALIFGSFT